MEKKNTSVRPSLRAANNQLVNITLTLERDQFASWSIQPPGSDKWKAP